MVGLARLSHNSTLSWFVYRAVLSHLLNSSFATAPLILPSSIAAREGAHSPVNPSSPSPPPFYLYPPYGGGRTEGGTGSSIDVRTPLLCAGELRASRLSFC